VTDPAAADIVLVVGTDRRVAGATANTYGNTTYVNPRRVVDIVTSFILKGQGEPFFSETERASLFRKSATKRCIDDFKNRLEEQAQP